MDFSLKAQQSSIRLALEARQELAGGRALLARDAEEAREHFMNAFDLARQAGVVCGRHDLPAPFALTQVQDLMVAFDDGEAEGALERELETQARIQACLDEAA